MRYAKQTLARSLRLGVFVLILATISGPAFAQVLPGSPIYPYGPGPAPYVNPMYPYVLPGMAPNWALPYSGNLYSYVNPVYAPTPVLPGPIVPNPIVPMPIVPNMNVMPNAPQAPGSLSPNIYGIAPYGSAPEAVIWGGESVRPFWFNPRLP